MQQASNNPIFPAADNVQTKERPPMKTIRFFIFRVFLMSAFLSAYLCFLYGRESG